MHTYFCFSCLLPFDLVTWDYNSTSSNLMGNPSAFAHLPLKESDAIIDGFMLLTDCTGN